MGLVAPSMRHMPAQGTVYTNQGYDTMDTQLLSFSTSSFPMSSAALTAHLPFIIETNKFHAQIREQLTPLLLNWFVVYS